MAFCHVPDSGSRNLTASPNGKTSLEHLIGCMDSAYMAGLAKKNKIAQPCLSDSDWKAVLKQTSRHKLSAVLYNCYQDHKDHLCLPDFVIGTLRESYLCNVAANMRIYNQLRLILRAFETAGIPVIALKGAHLARVVYGNIGLRKMNDLDLLIPAKHAKKAVREMKALGYNSCRPFAVDVESAVCQHLPEFIKKDSAPVEIHLHIKVPTSSLRIEREALWKRAWTESFSGIGMKVLCPEDSILHLSLHTAFHHLFDNGLISLWDLKASILYYGKKLNWDELVDRARLWGMSNCLHLNLYLARKWVQAPVPEFALNNLQPETLDPKMIVLAEEALFQAQSGKKSALSDDGQLIHWRLARSFPEKTKLFLKIAFPSKDDLSQIYSISHSDRRILLYRFVRIKDLFLELLRLLSDKKRKQKPPSGNDGIAPDIKKQSRSFRNWLVSR